MTFLGYKNQIDVVLPRILALFDNSKISKTFGIGDRTFWGWKLIDFPNGTFQGAVHGLARLVSFNMLPDYISSASIVNRIVNIIRETDKIIRPDGSTEEAFPYESSYCVTGLVAYDFLSALILLKDRLDEVTFNELTEVVKRLITFLLKNKEEHAIITNHLATVVAALTKWDHIVGSDSSHKINELLKTIYTNQSSEGWYSEYGGADPGYQTLAIYYLADANTFLKSKKLDESLEKSLEFLSYSIHPDGSFGGVYGNRNTRFFYPGGLELLKHKFPICRKILFQMRKSIEEMRVVCLLSMDEQNLIPMFNSYVMAAELIRDNDLKLQDYILPYSDPKTFVKKYSKAGVYFIKTPKGYSWLSLSKGGSFGVYDVESGKSSIDYGSLYEKDGEYYSTQNNCAEIVSETESQLKLKTRISKVNQMLPSPLKFIILRLLNIGPMRIKPLGEIVKKILVHLLVTNKKGSIGYIVRTFNYNSESLLVEEHCSVDSLNRIDAINPYYCIHMASQGYWQVSDDTKV